MSIVQPGTVVERKTTRIELPLSPDLTDIDYPDLTFLDLSVQAQDDEGGFEAMVEWLSSRRSLADRNQFEIGWACDKVVTRYGEAARDKWAKAAGFTAGTIGRFWWVAARWKPEEVRQGAGVHPGASFKHFTELTKFKNELDENGEPRDFEEVLQWLQDCADFNWSAATLKKKLSGEEDDDSEDGKPMSVHGELLVDEVWVQDDKTGGKVKKGALMLILDDTLLAEIVDKATRRGFLGEFVEMIIKHPKDD
jgi:hypothetical protein